MVGTDITPIQSLWVPPNVDFELEDATSAWSYPDNSFDYVHIRYLFGSIPDWDALFQEAFRVLKPGGYVESLEPSTIFRSDDGSIEEGSALDQWGKVFHEGGRRLGRSFRVVEDDLQRKGMASAGFGEPVVEDFQVPLGPWPQGKKWREVGYYCRAALEQDVEGEAHVGPGKGRR